MGAEKKVEKKAKKKTTSASLRPPMTALPSYGAEWQEKLP